MADEKSVTWAKDDFGFETRAIQAGKEPVPMTGAVVTPLFLTSTFAQAAPGEHIVWAYSRTGNPTRCAFEACVANLESARFGFAFDSDCLGATVSGHLTGQGDHVVACDDMSGGTSRSYGQMFREQGIESQADLSDDLISALDALTA